MGRLESDRPEWLDYEDLSVLVLTVLSTSLRVPSSGLLFEELERRVNDAIPGKSSVRHRLGIVLGHLRAAGLIDKRAYRGRQWVYWRTGKAV